MNPTKSSSLPIHLGTTPRRPVPIANGKVPRSHERRLRSRAAVWRQLALCLLAPVSVFAVELPRQISEVYPPDAGVMDVTKPPYNAKGDGVTDDTAAINAALRDHNASAPGRTNLQAGTVYFPPGVYLVSDTILPRHLEMPDEDQSGIRYLGAGVDQTTIRLADHAPSFNNPEKPREVIRTGNNFLSTTRGGSQPNSGFANYFQNLTIDVGKGNPGAVGVRYDVANMGSMNDVRIVSSDPHKTGAAGITFRTNCGLGYLNRVLVEGFDIGIHFVDGTVNNIAMENITLRGQRQAGIHVAEKTVSILGLRSENRVPALVLERPLAAVSLLNAQLTGGEGGPAIVRNSENALYLRDVSAEGYASLVQMPPSQGFAGVRGQGPSGLEVSEWWCPVVGGQTKEQALRLPIEPTPEFHEPDLSQWASVLDFGAKADEPGHDSAPGIQAAIDSGKPVVYFPLGTYHIGSDIVVRGAVRKVDFLFSNLRNREGTTPKILIQENPVPEVVLTNLVRGENLPLVHASAAVVSLVNIAGGPISMAPEAKGPLFVEIAGPRTDISIGKGHKAWLRAVNRENHAGYQNHGGTMWIYADNIEGMRWGKRGAGRKDPPPVYPVHTSGGGTTEYIAGCIDVLDHQHVPESGALFLTENSTLRANASGEIRAKEGQRGNWPLVFRTVQGETKTDLADRNFLQFWPDGSSRGWKKAPGVSRIVVPPYFTTPPKKEPSNP